MEWEVEKALLPKNAEESEVLSTIDKMNRDPKIHGILLLRPLPKHLNEERIVNAVAEEKDVDGITDLSLQVCLWARKQALRPVRQAPA